MLDKGAFTAVIKRTGERISYDASCIMNAMNKAFEASAVSVSEQELFQLVSQVEKSLLANLHKTPHIEVIQDIVEEVLMQNSYYKVAKNYIVYRQKRCEERLSRTISKQKKIHSLVTQKRDLSTSTFNLNKTLICLRRVSKDLDPSNTPLDPIITELEKNIFNDITTKGIEDALILSAVAFIERDPGYDTIAARLLRQKLYKEVMEISMKDDTHFRETYQSSFKSNILLGVEHRYFADALAQFDLDALAEAIQPDRDDMLEYIGTRTLYDRYLVKHGDQCIETLQAFWMRVAMGLAINEGEKRTEKTKEFYALISQLYYMPSTPTLFHAGLAHPQLSSCYISTIGDDLQNIFKCIGDNAQLAKWSGGIGNDWTPVRATNAKIQSTKVESQGIIPFLKIANDTTLAINRSGKRRGATCAYLEVWHADIEDFVDLRKNTGDDRRRTHDMNIAVWVPDLFMKRVQEQGQWTLFSPDETTDLHDLYGAAFEDRYISYERMAQEGSVYKYKCVDAIKLWRKILTRLFETGHPWITFKDPCNIRSPQDHMGVVHSSNLCTEITLNNSLTETAVCNLGSINLSKHVSDEGLNQYKLSSTIKTAMRMLDNVIDINFYPTEEARKSNLRHRPIGLGLMGLQDALFNLQIPFDNEQALEFVDTTMEFISYNAILASSELAAERGAYETFKGSKWDRGLLPFDTIALLEEERKEKIEVNRTVRLDWDVVRDSIKKYGMRNSNTMAIAPTATISNIVGVFPCIEPIYKNIYVKSNMSGEFTVMNKYLVKDLKSLGLWSQKMLEKIKYYDGSISYIEDIPTLVRDIYKETFEIDPLTLLKLTAVRAKWIDQSQSHNIFVKEASGKKLHDIYTAAWKMGLKTTYYLRTMGATQIEKSTLDAKEYGYTQKREYRQESDLVLATDTKSSISSPASQVGDACSILDPDCEACQ